MLLSYTMPDSSRKRIVIKLTVPSFFFVLGCGCVVASVLCIQLLFRRMLIYSLLMMFAVGWYCQYQARQHLLFVFVSANLHLLYIRQFTSLLYSLLTYTYTLSCASSHFISLYTKQYESPIRMSTPPFHPTHFIFPPPKCQKKHREP